MKTETTFPSIKKTKPTVIQLNTGKRCNQVCEHCHVDAGPDRTEDMGEMVAKEIAKFAHKHKFEIGDITGGAPEINKQFPFLLEEFTKACDKVIVRCNLTAALSRKKSIGDLFKKFRPVIVASMPCYEAKNVDKQRGDGVFDKSILALQWLNELGYGTEYELTLVYNPLSPVLPPKADELEQDYKKALKERFDIDFTSLITIANVPVGRYVDYLQAANLYDNYIQLLKDNFNASTVPSLMCRNHINIDWQGNVFDCDFNQQIELHPFNEARKIWELDIDEWQKQPVVVRDHCFTCTAGAGSSCQGSLD